MKRISSILAVLLLIPAMLISAFAEELLTAPAPDIAYDGELPIAPAPDIAYDGELPIAPTPDIAYDGELPIVSAPDIAYDDLPITPAPGYAVDGQKVVDFAGILTDSEEASLTAELERISTEYQCDVALLTVETLGTADYEEAMAAAEVYADNYYDYHGYGQGTGRDGIILLYCPEYRDYYFSTRGYGITAFTDYGQEYLIGTFADDLRSGNYAAAFATYASESEWLLGQAANGTPYDIGENDTGEKEFGIKNFLILLVIGFIAGLIFASISVAGMKSRHKSVVRAQNANFYLREGSMNLTGSSEMFLYKRTTAMPRVTESSGGGGGGGSRTHTSSSGATHGGGGGRL